VVGRRVVKADGLLDQPQTWVAHIAIDTRKGSSTVAAMDGYRVRLRGGEPNLALVTRNFLFKKRVVLSQRTGPRF
jgi:hypothetical protein